LLGDTTPLVWQTVDKQKGLRLSCRCLPMSSLYVHQEEEGLVTVCELKELQNKLAEACRTSGFVSGVEPWPVVFSKVEPGPPSIGSASSGSVCTLEADGVGTTSSRRTTRSGMCACHRRRGSARRACTSICERLVLFGRGLLRRCCQREDANSRRLKELPRSVVLLWKGNSACCSVFCVQ